MKPSGAALPVLPWHADAVASLARAAGGQRLGHAWLIHGPPGIGKYHLARAVAAILVRGEPANTWQALLPATASPQDLALAPIEAADIHLLAPTDDRKSIGVDAVRERIDDIHLTSHSGHARVVVIAPAERLTASAANSLLKALEEPPAGVYWLLLSGQPGRLPITILSRCQRLRIAPPTARIALDWLAQSAVADVDWSLALLLAGGNPLTALQLASNGVPARDADRCTTLVRILSGAIDVADVVEEWLKPSPDELLEWLRGRLEDALRSRHAVPEVAPAPHRAVWAAATALGALRLLQLRDGVGRLQRLVQNGAGINVGLALEAQFLAVGL